MALNKSLNSKGLDSQSSIADQLNEALKPLGCQVIPFDDFIKQSASKAPESPVVAKPDWIKEETRPSYCDCDYLVNGKSGRICRTHLFAMYRATLKGDQS